MAQGSSGYNLITNADVTTSGTIAALSQSVALTLNGQSSASIQITGTWVGTLQFEGSLDGTSWTAINSTLASTSVPVTTGNTNGLYRLTPGGFQQFRVVSTSWTSGTAIVTIRASIGTAGVFANQIMPIKIYDGTN